MYRFKEQSTHTHTGNRGCLLNNSINFETGVAHTGCLFHGPKLAAHQLNLALRLAKFYDLTLIVLV